MKLTPHNLLDNTVDLRTVVLRVVDPKGLRNILKLRKTFWILLSSRVSDIFRLLILLLPHRFSHTSLLCLVQLILPASIFCRH